MDKQNIAWHELHLYNDKVEMGVKTLIWIASWIGGIFVFINKEYSYKMLGSAYFFFSLSILMEFLPRIKEKNEYIGRISHTIFCMFSILNLFMSIALLLDFEPNKLYINIMFIFSLMTVIYMIFDLVAIWILKSTRENSKAKKEPNLQIQQKSIKVQCFRTNLSKGNLGNIEKGDEKNE